MFSTLLRQGIMYAGIKDESYITPTSACMYLEIRWPFLLMRYQRRTNPPKPWTLPFCTPTKASKQNGEHRMKFTTLISHESLYLMAVKGLFKTLQLCFGLSYKNYNNSKSRALGRSVSMTDNFQNSWNDKEIDTNLKSIFPSLCPSSIRGTKADIQLQGLLECTPTPSWEPEKLRLLLEIEPGPPVCQTSSVKITRARVIICTKYVSYFARNK